MKYIFLLLLSMFLAGCVTTSSEIATGTALVLKEDSQYQIVLPDAFANWKVKSFVEESTKVLQEALRETVGIDAPIVKESARKPGKAIYIGNTEAVRALGVDASKFQNFDCLIAVRDGNIYLVGNDRDRYGRNDKVETHVAGNILGSVKATIVFLEDYLGTRFVMPGKMGIDYAERQAVTIPSQLWREVKPQLIFATGRVMTLMYTYSNNNFGSGSFHTYGGHSYYDACPEKEFGKTHPEYFILHAGKRDPSHNHLCISNPKVQELIYQEALKRLDAGATATQLAQTDGYIPCECENCKKLANTDDPGEKLWVIHRAMAERLMKDRPGKMLHIISYGPTANPPKSFDSFPDNVIIELCSYTQKSFDAWSKIRVKRGFTTYVYNWGWYPLPGFTPKTTPTFCANQIRLFVKNNVRGIYRCGFGELFGLEGPSYYVYGKMLDDINQDPNLLAEEYYARAFGKARAPMAAFFHALYERLDLLWTPYSRATTTMTPRNLLGAIYTPDLLELLETNLQRAESLADTQKVKARLLYLRKEFDYAKNLGQCIALYNAYRVNPNEANFNQLADRIEERNAMIDSFFDEKGRIKPVSPELAEVNFMNWPDKAALMVNGRLGAILAAPFTWDIKALREKKILPGLSCRSMKVKAAIGSMTEDFEAGAWCNAAWTELGGIQLNAIEYPTRFKALYDKENLYFAIETARSEKAVEFTPCGHDGPAWGQDCMELTINPSGMRNSYYHFIWNGCPESFYESAIGFITDPLHPLFNKDDVGWNGKWNYTVKIANGKWRSLVTIPFVTLGVPAPQAGAHWTWNVCKETYKPELGTRSNPELSLWSPNLERMSFHDMEAFGDVTFE